jgi:poly(A) polymerase
MTVPPRLDHAQWLREGALARLLAVLDGDGEEARVVGGAVRNAMLGEPIGEFDVATTALPAEVIRRASAQGFKTVPTGIDHGTVTVVVDGRPFEVTTLREDVETFGRKARVAFGRDWKADAERRDFTINALSVSRDGTVHDHVGGLADLQKHHVRFIGDPAARIAEDYLRILRFFRFQAHYGEGLPDREGLAACIAARAGLATLSRERVRAELLKLLLGRHAVPVLAVMSECGLLVAVLGGVPLLASVSNLAKIEQATGVHPDAVRRLGALAVFVPEDAQRLADRLRLANAELERLASMGERWRALAPDPSGKSARVLLYRLGPDLFVDRVLIAWSRSQAGITDPAWRALLQLPQHWIIPLFPLKAADFMQRGVEKGPALGAALAAAEIAWIEADFPADENAVAAITSRAIETARKG